VPPNIVLIGFMGSGKSTVGRLVAQQLAWRFVDTDTLIERVAGCDIPALFVREGEASFRERESVILHGVGAGIGQVISTGGGAILREDNVRVLRGSGMVVWLTAHPETIAERTSRRRASRPLLTGEEDPLTKILRLLGERSPIYQKSAHRVVDTTNRSPQAIASEIVRCAERWESME
jgi:shikimate kinase